MMAMLELQLDTLVVILSAPIGEDCQSGSTKMKWLPTIAEKKCIDMATGRTG